MKRRPAILVSLIVVLVCAPPAGAATQIGQTFTPNPSMNCVQNFTYLQTTSPGSQYVVPFTGVLTSWSFEALGAGNISPLKLKVGRPAGANDFTIVAQSAVETPAPNVLSAFPTRIPVQADDVIGFTPSTNVGRCARVDAAYAFVYRFEDVLPGGPPLTYFNETNTQLDVSASLEADGDGDGFGDETQDACPADPALAQAPCDRIAPDTAITKGPKDKTKKKQATFEFSGTDARALAGFECSLDGGAFAACTSPHTLKVKKGKHTFSVRATDQTGNVDGTPASNSWKVKKKKKKK